ncbi:PucR family transcriptional regulator, partial [Paenibacillus jamilae]
MKENLEYEINRTANLPVFQGTSVIAGTQGMEREVNTVNMMDAPDIINFLKKNELLITTAFHFKDDLHLLLELIQEMAKQGCSGLAIKTKRYLDKIPEAAVSLANELQLPLLELPIQTSLGDIVNKSLSYILDIRTNELHNAIQTHRQFTNHILSGMGIDKILDSLSSLIQLPVVLLNHYLQPIIQNYSQLTLLDNLEDVIISQLHPLSKTSPSAFSLLNETRDSITLFPISTHKQTNFLCIIGFVPLTDRNKILTIEQASNVIAFELMKENALKQNQRRIQNDFFTNFINGTFSTDEEIINRGKEFGLLSDQR